jgi:hypothetical protein
MLVRLSRAPGVSIASIRGRATGVGSELALACDMRFASREKAILSHFEVGAGIVPGGGPMARLPRLMGRGRALEVLLGADDIPGDLAERYGYVNRSFPDADLDAFVDALATRIASFDKRAISETKRFADIASLPPDHEIAPAWDVCLASIMRPAAQERIKKVIERGFHEPGMWSNASDITSASSALDPCHTPETRSDRTATCWRSSLASGRLTGRDGAHPLRHGSMIGSGPGDARRAPRSRAHVRAGTRDRPRLEAQPPTGFPQFPQNFAPGPRSEPHSVHFLATGASG